MTVGSAGDLRGVVAAVGADEHAVVRLEAEPETLRQRIIAREPETFTELDQLTAASARLSQAIAGLAGVALALSTERRRPAAVAEQFATRAGELRARPPRSPRRCAPAVERDGILAIMAAATSLVRPASTRSCAASGTRSGR